MRFIKLSKDVPTPAKANPDDAGFDLTVQTMKFCEGGVVQYGTGVKLEVPVGKVALLFPRGSVWKKESIICLTNCVGVVDAGYQGEVVASFQVKDGFNDIYEIGERCCQIVVIDLSQIELEECQDFGVVTARGEGKHGSSGE